MLRRSAAKAGSSASHVEKIGEARRAVDERLHAKRARRRGRMRCALNAAMGPVPGAPSRGRWIERHGARRRHATPPVLVGEITPFRGASSTFFVARADHEIDAQSDRGSDLFVDGARSGDFDGLARSEGARRLRRRARLLSL